MLSSNTQSRGCSVFEEPRVSLCIMHQVGAVKQAIQACALQLKSKIARAQAAREQKQRKRNLTKWVMQMGWTF